MLRWSAVSLLLVCLTLTTFGQSPTHEHIPAPSDIIDGAKTPDLIPDVVAWRLWLLAATAGDSKYPDLASPRRTSFLRVAGIGPDDMPVAEDLILHFRTDYQSLIDTFNKRVNSGEKLTITEFQVQRDSLVQALQTSMSGQLSQRSIERLKRFIIKEKAQMQVAKEDQ